MSFSQHLLLLLVCLALSAAKPLIKTEGHKKHVLQHPKSPVRQQAHQRSLERDGNSEQKHTKSSPSKQPEKSLGKKLSKDHTFRHDLETEEAEPDQQGEKEEPKPFSKKEVADINKQVEAARTRKVEVVLSEDGDTIQPPKTEAIRKTPPGKQNWWTRTRYSDHPWFGREMWLKMNDEGSWPKRPDHHIKINLDEIEGIQRVITCEQRRTGYMDCVGGLLMLNNMTDPTIQYHYRQKILPKMDNHLEAAKLVSGDTISYEDYPEYAKSKVLSVDMADIGRQQFPTMIPDFTWPEEDRKSPYGLAKEFLEHSIANLKNGYLGKREASHLLPWERSENKVGEVYTVMAATKMENTMFFNILSQVYTLFSYKMLQYYSKHAAGYPASKSQAQSVNAQAKLTNTQVQLASAANASQVTNLISFPTRIGRMISSPMPFPAMASQSLVVAGAPASSFVETAPAVTPTVDGAPITWLSPFWWPKTPLDQWKFVMGSLKTFYSGRCLILAKAVLLQSTSLVVHILNGVQRNLIAGAIKSHLDYVVKKMDDMAQAVWRYSAYHGLLHSEVQGGKNFKKLYPDAPEASYSKVYTPVYPLKFKPLDSPEEVNDVVLSNKLASIKISVPADVVVVTLMQKAMWSGIDKSTLSVDTQITWIKVVLKAWFSAASTNAEDLTPQEMFDMLRTHGGKGVCHFKTIPFGWVALESYARAMNISVYNNDKGSSCLPKETVSDFVTKRVLDVMDVFDPEIKAQHDNMREPDFGTMLTLLGYAKWPFEMRADIYDYLAALGGETLEIQSKDLLSFILPPVTKYLDTLGKDFCRPQVPDAFHHLNKPIVEVNFGSLWRYVDVDRNGHVEYAELEKWWMSVEDKLRNSALEQEDSDPVTASQSMEEGRSKIKERQDFSDIQDEIAKYKKTLGAIKLHRSWTVLKLMNLNAYVAYTINLPMYYLKFHSFMSKAKENFQKLQDVYLGKEGGLDNYLWAYDWITSYEQTMLGLYSTRWNLLVNIPAALQFNKNVLMADLLGVATKAKLGDLDILNEKKENGEINVATYAQDLVELQKEVAEMNAKTAVFNKRSMALKLARVNITAIAYTMGSQALMITGRSATIKLMMGLQSGVGKLDCPAKIGSEYAAMLSAHIGMTMLHMNVVKHQTGFKMLNNKWRHLDRLLDKKTAMDDIAAIKADGMPQKQPDVFAAVNAHKQGIIGTSDERAFMRLVDFLTFLYFQMDLKIAQWWLGIWKWNLGITQKYFESRLLADPSCSAAKAAATEAEQEAKSAEDDSAGEGTHADDEAD